MINVSQRDERWGDYNLGFSSKKIKDYGCLITAIASVLDTTPDVVNNRLKSVNGFLNQNLVIWKKIEEAFPGITVRREWTYNNEDVANNLPAIVQVDGTPIGATMHFVVYIGNQQLMDVWDGKTKPTSTYKAKSYAILKGKWEKKQTMEIEQDLFEQLVNKSTLYDEFYKAGYDNFNKLNVYLTEKDKEVSRLSEEVSELKKANTTLTARNEHLNKAMEQDTVKDRDLEVKNLELDKKLASCTTDLNTIAVELGMDNFDQKIILKKIDELRKPVDEQVKPVLKERNELYKLFFNDMLGLYKRVRKQKGLYKKIRKWLGW